MSIESPDADAPLATASQPVAPTAEIQERDPSGRFGPGNRFSMTHGLRSKQVEQGLLPEQAEAVAGLAERVAGITADLGGIDQLSTVVLGLIERHARLELIEGYLWTNLETNGVLTGKGRQRAALSAYLSVTDRLQRSAGTLGVQRQPNRVPMRTEPTDLVTRIENVIIDTRTEDPTGSAHIFHTDAVSLR